MNSIQLKCPNCGGEVVFKPDIQKFECPYCMSQFTETEVNGFNPGITTHMPEGNTGVADDTLQQDFNNHTNVYYCDSCGAEIITDDNTAATFCYYCHNPVALKGRLTGQYRPSHIIPFKGTKEQATEAYKLWSKKKWFLPKSWLSDIQLEKIVGLYVPYWLADTKVRSFLQGEGYISTSHISGDYRVTTTKVYHIVRDAEMQYIKIPADGSKKIDDGLIDAVEPFNYDELISFNSAYLSGFYADKYDVSKEDVVPKIYSRVYEGTKQFIDSTTTAYTAVNSSKRSTTITKIDWDYVLLPVWFMTYNYKDKKYFFAMNGQTGKISGILPVSAGKLAAVCGIIAGVVLTIATLIAFLGGPQI